MQPEAEISIMASAAGFKQQCPSCEALVPIRDPDLVGRKIDCPKCKYRFVVEDPAAADGDAGPAKKNKKGDDKGGKKPAKGTAKRRSDEDGESSAASKGSSNKILIGALAGGVALVGLAITAWVWFQDDSSSTTKTPSVASSSASKPPSAEDTEEKKPAVDEKPAAASAEMVTNLLPPDTEGVCAVKLQNFVRTPLGNAVFASPGTFLVGGLEKNLGFKPSDVDLFLQGWNFTSNWTVSIVHNTKGFDKNAVVAALKLKPAEAKIEDQEYYTAESNPWLEALGRAAFAKLLQTSPSGLTPRAGKLGARFYDDQTLVLADLEPLQAFLKAKGSFELRKPVKAEEKKEEGTGSASDSDAAQSAGSRKRMGMTMGAGGAPANNDFPTIASSGGGAAAQKSDAKPAESEAKESIAYMTIQPAIKAMLDRLDSKQPILALAVDREAAKGKVGALSTDPVGFDVVIKDSQVVGAAIVWKDHLTFLMGGDFGAEDGAKRRLRDLEKQSGKDLTKKMGQLLGVPVEFLNDEEENDPLGTPGGAGAMPGRGAPPGVSMPGGGMGRPRSGPGGPPPGMGGGGRRGGGGGGDDAIGGPGGRGQVGGGRPGMGAPMGMGGPPGFGGPGFGQNPNAEPPPPKDPPKATARAAIQDRTVVMLTVEVLDNEPKDKLLNKIVRPAMIQAKGSLDMSGGRSRVHELAAASQHMAEKLQRQFPQAALERAVPSTRMGRPYAPDQRISWMAELLPYLGQSALYSQIDPAHSWRDPENVGNASTLISQFLSPNTAPESWWVKYPGVSDPVAATHFVGIAGVGLDAANYGVSDPAVADKIGIFGYDRHTALRDITDGAANTILMAQVPPMVKRPWLAGGGATAVGVPEKNSVKPFVSLQPNGKKGTLVVMADGSVRFISENVSDEVFKALATIKGNESVILNREAPRVEAPADEVVEAKSPAAAVPAVATPPVVTTTPAAAPPVATPPVVTTPAAASPAPAPPKEELPKK